MEHSIGIALSLIQEFEGFKERPYLCPAGKWTIGYGHLLTEEEKKLWENKHVTPEEALSLLKQDVYRVECSLKRLVKVLLSTLQYNALLSFVFNVGSGSFQRSQLRQYVNREEHEQVPSEFMRWVWVNFKKSRGLVRRRQAEAVLYQADLK